MDLTLLRSFVALAEHGGITEAARVVGVSQSAFSRRMALLQQELGVPLLERSGRSVVFTGLGRVALGEARRLLQRYDALRALLNDHKQLKTGVVRIGGGATAVSFLLPKAIARFRTSHPEIVFQLKEAGSRETEMGVQNGDLELGVITLPKTSRELFERPLFTDRIIPVASANHPLAQKRRLRVEDLEGQSVVGFEAGTAIRLLIDAALREVGVSLNVVMELRSVAAILQMVETTQSLAFVSELAFAPELLGGAALASATKADGMAVRSLAPRTGGAVVPLKVSGLKISRELGLISMPEAVLSPASRQFCSVLFSTLDRRPQDAS